MPPLESNALLPHDSEAAQPRPPRLAHAERPVWKDRIGTYLLGVGIGIVLVVMFLAARAQYRSSPAAPAAPPVSTPTPTPAR